MTTEAALTKLAYLFALPNATTRSVAEDMVKPLRGELTESSTPIFEHPKVSVPQNALVFDDLCRAISLGDIERVQAILSSQDRRYLNNSDYMGNMALVSSSRILGSLDFDRSLYVCSMWPLFHHQLPSCVSFFLLEPMQTHKIEQAILHSFSQPEQV